MIGRFIRVKRIIKNACNLMVKISEYEWNCIIFMWQNMLISLFAPSINRLLSLIAKKSYSVTKIRDTLGSFILQVFQNKIFFFLCNIPTWVLHNCDVAFKCFNFCCPIVFSTIYTCLREKLSYTYIYIYIYVHKCVCVCVCVPVCVWGAMNIYG